MRVGFSVGGRVRCALQRPGAEHRARHDDEHGHDGVQRPGPRNDDQPHRGKTASYIPLSLEELSMSPCSLSISSRNPRRPSQHKTLALSLPCALLARTRPALLCVSLPQDNPAKPSMTTKMGAAAAGGFFAAFLSLPFDLLKSRLQVSRPHASAQRSISESKSKVNNGRAVEKHARAKETPPPCNCFCFFPHNVARARSCAPLSRARIFALTGRPGRPVNGETSVHGPGELRDPSLPEGRPAGVLDWVWGLLRPVRAARHDHLAHARGSEQSIHQHLQHGLKKTIEIARCGERL